MPEAEGARRQDLGAEAWRFQTGGRPRLACLGPPEPLLGSWAATPPPPAPEGSTQPRHAYRGRFRESYREALDLLAPSYRRLAQEAAGRGLLDDPSDAFFLPLDLADDLTADHRPDWLAGAVAANRREYIAHRTRPCPADRLEPDCGDPGPPDVWELCPLNPLP